VSKEARVAALEALYGAEALNGPPSHVGLSARSRRLVDGVTKHRSDLDAAITDASRGWRIERMPIIDRCVLRLALYELTFTETPVAVVIDEAVELAKTYSTTRSGGFINGVLGTLAESRSRETTPGTTTGSDVP
jgi:N utilization substance protein B